MSNSIYSSVKFMGLDVLWYELTRSSGSLWFNKKFIEVKFDIFFKNYCIVWKLQIFAKCLIMQASNFVFFLYICSCYKGFYFTTKIYIGFTIFLVAAW
ncbi:hypothetical protein F8M41_007703 [Gigaspora margarita]|uniref:Uncharacterized protein n=1 Tax=Gigaspora margarita TaxID=4874 RepID=A0A8H4A547_GIGMA|nr:hypothetical protein F8M41_007703 [Gigaspora margarita]